MKKILMLAGWMGMYFLLPAQVELIKQKPETISSKGKIYALIVGISEYENIKNLDYADDDAQDFYNFLVKESELGVDSNNVKLLLNKNATSANVGKELLKLKNRMEQGSTFFIYFAGHGDANGEAQAFLLASDLPKIEDPSLYAFNGGVIHVYFLKDEIRKIITEKNANVVLVTDACRTNELAGSKEGAKTYVNKIMEKNSGEIQFISCAADEKSEESDNWGQGRGVFSYYFMNGLRGLADTRPVDGKVTVRELYDYVQKNVEDATTVTDEQIIAITGRPYRQSPQYCCTEKQNQTLVLVSETLKQQTIAKMATADYGIKLASSRDRTFGKRLATNDTFLQQLYDKFYTALENKQLVSPKGNSAWDYYNHFVKKAGNKNPVIFDLTEDIKAALLNDAQNMINSFYSYTDQWGMSDKTKRTFYDQGVDKLRKARSLMDKNDTRSPIVKLTRQCMEAAGIFASSQPKDWERGIKIMDSAILAFPANPLPWFLKGRLQYNQEHYDEALVNLKKSHHLAPKWSMPLIGISDVYYELETYDSSERILTELAETQNTAIVFFKLGFFYGEVKKDYNLAVKYSKMAHVLAPNKTNVINNIGAYYEQWGEVDSAHYYFKKAFEVDSNNAFTLTNIGRSYMEEGNYEEAEKIFLQALKADSTESRAYSFLAELYTKISNNEYKLGPKYKNWEKAIINYTKAIQLAPNNLSMYIGKAKLEAEMDKEKAENTIQSYLKFGKANANYYNEVGIFYENINDIVKAKQAYKKGIQTDSNYYYPWFNMGEIYYQNSQWDSCLKYYYKAKEIDENLNRLTYKIENAENFISRQEQGRKNQESKIKMLANLSADREVLKPLADLYYEAQLYDSAYIYYKEAIEHNPAVSEEAYINYLLSAQNSYFLDINDPVNKIGAETLARKNQYMANSYISHIKNTYDTTRLAKAEELYEMVVSNHPNYYNIKDLAIWIAVLYTVTGNTEKILYYIEEGLKYGYPVDYLDGNYDFYELYDNKKYNKLLKKYLKIEGEKRIQYDGYK